MTPISFKVVCISVDLIGLLICLLLRFDFGSDITNVKSYDKKIFNWLIFFTALILFSDAVTWAFLNVPKYYVLAYLSTALYYSLHLLICTMWVMYCDYLIHENQKRNRIVAILFLIPTAVVAFLSFFSYKTSALFRITTEGEYFRGEFYYEFLLFCFLYLVYSVYIFTKKILQDRRKGISDKRLMILIVYPILPFVGVVLQTLYYGVNIVWILTTISLIIVYFNFQNAQLIIDPLTQINNRYKFDSFMEKHLYDNNGLNLKFLMIIDIDDFKQINDNWGHITGDHALQKVAEILKRNSQSNDLVARIGGDEFVVFGERNSIDDVEKLIEEIHLKVDDFNKQREGDYRLSLSIGYSLQDQKGTKTKNQMITEADKHMYDEKAKKSERKAEFA